MPRERARIHLAWFRTTPLSGKVELQNASTVGQVVTQTMQLRGTDVPSTYFVSETVTPASFSVPALDTRKQALLGIALLGIGLTLLKLSRRRRVRRA